MPTFGTSIPDDRTPPRVVPLWIPDRAGTEHRVLSHRVLEEVRAAQRAYFFKPMRAEGAVSFLGMAASVIGGRVIANALGGGTLLWLAIVALGVLLSGFISHRMAVHRKRRWIRVQIIDAGCCASCGYDLHALPPGPDGLTICPECDAAWRFAGVDQTNDQSAR